MAEVTMPCGCRVEVAWQGVPGQGTFTISWHRCPAHCWAEAMEHLCRHIHENNRAALNARQRRFLDRLIRRLDGAGQ